MPDEIDRQAHFEWLINSRHRNLQSTLKLWELFLRYETQWKTKHYSTAAQELASVSFSLWRAAFLAEKTGKRSAVVSDATKFIERVIEDNAISYVQDKLMREWTFNYYTRNARFSLEYIHRRWPNLSVGYDVKIRPPKERWEYCQELLERAIVLFEAHFMNLASLKRKRNQKSVKRARKKTNRAIVRTMQLAGRLK